MSKIESGKLEIRKSKSSVGEMLEFICTQAAALCESKKINFYCNQDPKRYMNYFVNGFLLFYFGFYTQKFVNLLTRNEQKNN